MATIGFIGLGNMGLPMEQNLVKAGHTVCGFDLSEYASGRVGAAGGTRPKSVPEACRGAEVVITMLPAGEQVRQVYLERQGGIETVAADALLIESSTIDVETAREVAQAADEKGLAMIDAPVSGGVAGAQAASLTFMVGGFADAFERAYPVLETMGKTIVHDGGPRKRQGGQVCQKPQ